ncbi:adenine deaminase C-terminal domain-containing protein [Methylacidimicrobium sp. B4]|uniref:adenine deaminase C-terminal domain-containing protein n=1 Tax=Methylacidimicrobium sp. B4 TaxID=2796139 RepID=UPI001A8FEE83|nr:adenine deaminase C-terminal domain-containing protein [Methylacidimicrobium sp. B4]QSR84357.1 adenine deaminase [Methylacidimicrobium sp. B4]
MASRKKPFAVPPLAKMTRCLALVASGRRPPDLILRSARVLCPYTEAILPNREIWILGGRIAAVQPQGSAPPRWGRREYDVRGGIVAPGLIDPHVHIESSMVGACAYAEAALRNGTTTIFCDSHEIANVLGRRGIEWMLEDARRSPLSIFLTVPSTVPATNDRMETSGGSIDRHDVARLFDRFSEAVALGEKMDFVAVAAGHPQTHAILGEALRRGRPVCGHIYGEEFVAAYAASGITDTHEAGEAEIALQMLQAGMWIFLRGGPPLTPWHSLPRAIEAVSRLGASPKRLCVCTDDRDPDDLLLFGLDWVVREAWRHGLSQPLGWSLGSLHPALRFGMDREMGGLAPGRRADLVLLDDQGRVRNTWLGGELLVEEGESTPCLEKSLAARYRYPRSAYRTVRLPRRRLCSPRLPEGMKRFHLLGIEPPGILVRHRVVVASGAEISQRLKKEDLCWLAVLERHGKTAEIAWGLLEGFGLRHGAVASTVGHDAHNLLVAGKRVEEMELAARTLESAQGGVCVVLGERILALVELPVAGLLSDRRIDEVAEAMRRLKAAWGEVGCQLPYMGFNLLSLSVIPEIRLTNKGLVLVPEMRLVPLWEEIREKSGRRNRRGDQAVPKPTPSSASQRR